MGRVDGSRTVAAALVILIAGCTESAHANSASEALRARASAEIFNLDRDRAIATYREAIAADPQDPAAYRGLATGLWLSITFRRGNMTVDDYLGRVSRQTVVAVPPPPDTAAAFDAALDRALALARKRLEANPRDPEAHYQIGAALGLRASYIATVESSALRAFRTAREAYDEHEKVLDLDPRRKDAGLIVGSYRYIVSGLVLPLRWVAYLAGFDGDKERGISMVEEAAAYGGENEEDARFALVLMYNREGRYDQAVKQLELLRARYPGNRLAWLETGSTFLRAGRPSDAERVLTDGLIRFASDQRQRMFGEDALWYYKRGAARAALGRAADAQTDLKTALGREGRKWVYGRTHLELGKLALKAGNRRVAREEFQSTIALCESDNDALAADEAQRLLK